MKMMMEVKKHVDALKMIAEREGMPVEELIEMAMGEEEEGMEEKPMAMMEEGEDEEEKTSGPDKAKIALIVAKMKNGMKKE